MEKMLINAMQTEEVRVALIKDNHLFDLDIECPGDVKKKGNIYFESVEIRKDINGKFRMAKGIMNN